MPYSLNIQDNRIRVYTTKKQTNYLLTWGVFTSCMALQASGVWWNWTRNLNFHFAPTFLILTNRKNNTEETKGDAVSVTSNNRLPTLNKIQIKSFITIRWNEKTLCSNHTPACIVLSQIFTSRTKTNDCRRGPCLDQTKGIKGNFPFFFSGKSCQSSHDLQQPETWFYITA